MASKTEPCTPLQEAQSNGFECVDGGPTGMTKPSQRKMCIAAIVVTLGAAAGSIGVLASLISERATAGSTISFDLGCIRDHVGAHADDLKGIADCEVTSNSHSFGMAIAKALASTPVLSRRPFLGTRAPSPGMQSLTRRQVLGGMAAATAPLLLGGSARADAESEGQVGETPKGVKFTVVKPGKGPSPKKGEMILTRFKGKVKSTGAVFDDLTKTAEPYYMRFGVGMVLPGVENALGQMKVGSVWDLEVPSDLGFGKEGKPPSPGVPRIKPNEDLLFRVELVSIPGRDENLLELNGVDENDLDTEFRSKK